MKKILSVVLSFLIIFCLFTPVYASQTAITVYIDGSIVNFDVQPQITNGRTLVPMRAIFEKLGADVQWNSDTSTVIASHPRSTVTITIGQTTAYINGQACVLDVPATIIDSRTLVPLRFVAEALGCDVKWEGDTYTVVISTGENGANANYLGGDVLTFQEYSFDPVRKIKVSCEDVISGNTAESIVKSENRYNSDAALGQEWIIFKFNLEYISSSGGINDVLEASDVLFYASFYDTYKQQLDVHDTATWSHDYDGYGIYDIELYPGNSATVLVGLLVDSSAGDIYLEVPNDDYSEWIYCGSTVGENSNSYVAPAPSYSSSVEYYSGSAVLVPTYGSVVGTPLLDTVAHSEATLYKYDYTSSDDFIYYIEYLIDSGWEMYEIEEDVDDYTVYMVKTNELYMISVTAQFTYDQVWVIVQ